jgi:sigma-B regulation protein RsbU (phosphoserine phosphatase)
MLERLELLYRVSQTFNSSLDLNEVLNRVMDEVIAIMNAERGFVVLVSDDGQLSFHAARGMDQQTIDAPEFEVPRGTVQEVVRLGQPLLSIDARTDPSWISGRQSVMMLGLRSLLCVPLQVRDETFGVIYVDNRVKVGAFGEDDLELLSAIASSAAIAIDNARYYQAAVQQARLERELQVARDLQASFIPRRTPDIPRWDFGALWQPAREVSGDFYDFIPIAQDRWGVVIADVSDKGMPAALFMMLARSTIRASIAPALLPSACITQANWLLCEDSVNGMFVSLCYVLLDPSGEITYVNAGHNLPLLYQASTDTLSALPRSGIVLGIDEARDYSQQTLQLEPGDVILLYTDGVTEAINAAEEEFGLEPLREIVRAHHHLPASGLVQELEQAVREFTGETPPFDDVTVVAIKRL